jgi:hypothetical protein
MAVTRFSLAAAMIFTGTAWGQADSLPGQIPAENVGTVSIPARSADDFVDSMGINVHMEATQKPYDNYLLVNARLRELGMRHIRDEINDTSSSFASEIKAIGELGYTLCGLIEGGNDYPPVGTRLDDGAVVQLIQNLEPTIDAVEGPNEPDDGGFVYDKVPYPQGAINESIDLWNIVKGNSEISALPVVVMSEGNPADFSLLASITPPPIDYANFGNMHAYQGGGPGDNNLARLYIPDSRDLTGPDRLWTTEMGYHNNTHYLSDNEQQGVSQRASAIYLPIAFLSGFRLGVARTFSYELIDEVNDPHLASCSGSHPQCSGEGHYGLLNYDGSPKPAYTALKNLISILREPGKKDLAAKSLTVTFSGAPATMRYTLLQKSNGVYYLVLWNDVKVYKIATAGEPGRDLHPDNIPITLRFPRAERFTVYAPNDASGVNPTTAYTNAMTSNSIQLNLPAQVLLLEIQPDLADSNAE